MAMAPNRRVLHLQAAVVPDGDGFVASCVELNGLATRGVDVAEAVDRLRGLVARHLEQRPTPWPRHVVVVLFEVPVPAAVAADSPAAGLPALLDAPR
jgi:predicted RNase H-like HicB family nuclease